LVVAEYAKLRGISQAEAVQQVSGIESQLSTAESIAGKGRGADFITFESSMGGALQAFLGESGMSAVDVFNRVGTNASVLDLMALQPGALAANTGGLTRDDVMRAASSGDVSGLSESVLASVTKSAFSLLPKNSAGLQGFNYGHGFIHASAAGVFSNEKFARLARYVMKSGSYEERVAIENSMRNYARGMKDTTSMSFAFPEVAAMFGDAFAKGNFLSAEKHTAGLPGAVQRAFGALGALGDGNTFAEGAAQAALGAGGSFSDIADKIKAAAGIKGELTPEIIAANKDKLIGAFTTATYERATRELNTVKSDGSFSNPFWVREVPKVTGG
jgi:hypothetical protein